MIVQFCKYLFVKKKKQEKAETCVFTLAPMCTHSYCSILVSVLTMELIIICILGNKNGMDQFIECLDSEAIFNADVYGST